MGRQAQEMEIVNTEERLDRLEKMFERIYHENELLSLYIPKLMDVLIRYWGKQNEHRGSVRRDLITLHGFLSAIDDDVTGLLKGHHSHTDKKRQYKNIL